VQRAAHAERDLVAQDEVLEHHRTAKVDVAVLQPQLLGRVRAVLREKRRRLRAGEKLQPGGDDLDLAGRDVPIDLVAPTKHDVSLDLDDVLGPGVPRADDRLLARPGPVEEHLHDAAAVPHGQEDELA